MTGDARSGYPLGHRVFCYDCSRLPFLDIISITKANCAARMDYYQQLLVTLLVFKGVVLAVLLLAWLAPRAKHWFRLHKRRQTARAADRAASRDVTTTVVSGSETHARRRVAHVTRRSSVLEVIKGTPWVQVFRVESMVLFIAYPSVSVKIFRLFNCVSVAGSYYLVEDMRLMCYTRQWWGYAIYGIVMIAVYVLGLPAMTLYLLFGRRRALFGPGSESNMRKYGFLYDAYGPSAWFWETEELVRKLLLTAVAVLFNAGNPFQVWVRFYRGAEGLLQHWTCRFTVSSFADDCFSTSLNISGTLCMAR